MELKGIKLTLLEPIVKSAKIFYENSLTSYSTLSIYRVLQKYAEYFEGLTNLLKTTSPEEISFTSAYSKAAVKKMLGAYPLKEMKKAVELLAGRVQKHFADQKSLMLVVWKSVQEEFLRRQAAISEALEKVYPGASDVRLAYKVEDLIAYFSEVSVKS